MERCVDCGGDLLLVEIDFKVGDLVICPECGVELVVKVLRPLKLVVVADGEDA